ncbi:UDP-N-acetylmuramoyl-L-alanyl-D-glutamate--2,6-diaminopimelate ligase [Bacteroidales bacterium OttesenSCG-928-B11]|nr:UDP-N-acetylmuramoyl-L-alanyl-D-glutamate--2,6-diaminopimelate ligase [Bacteroidales bacterium OttesenSCG-928-C03]MDL2311613.1 UDP-N-acetylmuramoyl-L-alanyl-D-glutamate--2,6-diaminopimelate ligase [Bacteroidales bacterium OttesenSCG-928-B11]
MKKLDDLLRFIKAERIIGNNEKFISDITFDTRTITSDPVSIAQPLFVAQKGTNVDGEQFIVTAIENGAGVIVCESIPRYTSPDVTYLIVNNASETLGQLASAFYDYPSQQLHLVGITGTNGKTTVATLLYQLFRSLGHSVGLISTIENRINDEVIPSTHTTPDAVQLNRLLSRMVMEGCEYCFMEVSSHAVHQNRISGLEFRGGVFTNITHDHLDFHKTFAAYIKAKQGFFNMLTSDAFALTNRDDRNGAVMAQNSKANVKTYSLNNYADFKGKIIDNSFEGLQLVVDNEEVFFKLTGKFNAYNLLAIYGTAILLGENKDDVLVAMSNLESAAGRFQLIRGTEGRIAIIDYAHTPDALQNVLSTIKEITQHSVEIITVVGCGGDRDALKRPVMAENACKISNKVILTSDNPRTEDPYKILKEMEEGVPVAFRQNVLVIENRRSAIQTACMMLQPSGVLLVAGKGHENYQDVNGVKHHFDDSETVSEFFNLPLKK